MNRKSVHINLNEDIHAELRILAFKNKLSMQEIIESLVVNLINKDNYLESLVEKTRVNKKAKSLEKLTNTESKSIFDQIQNNSPWEK